MKKFCYRCLCCSSKMEGISGCSSSVEYCMNENCFHPVSGKSVKCIDARTDVDSCGADAKFFEPREKE